MWNQLIEKISKWIVDNTDYNKGIPTINSLELLKYLQSIKIL